MLAALEQELAHEQARAAADEALLRDLEVVVGCAASADAPHPPRADLVPALVRATNLAFAPPRSAQLRALLETLLNSAWADPNAYIDTQSYPTDVVDYVLHARLVEVHPSRPAQMRLVAFHEELPTTHAVRY